jgi:hypothetical protein
MHNSFTGLSANFKQCCPHVLHKDAMRQPVNPLTAQYSAQFPQIAQGKDPAIGLYQPLVCNTSSRGLRGAELKSVPRV